MKVLIFGGDGQLGQAIKTEGDFNVRCLSRADCDITLSREIDRTLKKEKCDVVINCAAFHNVSECEKDPARAATVNAYGAGLVAAIAKSHGCKSVYISTDMAHPDVSARTVYGQTKALGEALAANKGALIVRVSHLFGPYVCRAKGYNFPQLIARKLRAGEKVQVINTPVSMSYTLDAAETILDLLDDCASGIKNVVQSGVLKLSDVARIIQSTLGLGGEIEEINASTQRTSFPILPSTPALSLVGAIEHYCREYLSHESN